MKRIVFSFLLSIFSCGLFAQDIQSAIATRVLYFDNNALVDSSSEQLTPLNYGSVGVYSGSMKYTIQFEGAFYQAFYGLGQVFFRKSNDGILWSDPISITDLNVTGYDDHHPNIAVWRSGAGVHVGIAYIDSSQPLEQLAYVKSTDGGQTFGAPVLLSNHTDSNSMMNCGFSCKGDTLLATWTRYNSWSWDSMWESHSYDGGLTWSPQQVAYTGWQYTFTGDSDIDDDGNFYAVICADLGWRVELVTVRSTDAGQTWVQTTPPTNLGSSNTSTNAQIIVEDSAMFISATHSASYLDQANLHRSEDFGQNWSTIAVSDSDSLNVSSIGGSTNSFCHTAIARGGGNRIYMAWSDSRGHNQSDYALCDYYIYIAWSDDNGLTWSSNYRVSSSSNYGTTTNVYCNLSVIPGTTGDTVLVSWSKNRDVSVLQVFGCTAVEACNYNPEATIDDASCVLPGFPCDDNNPSTDFDVYGADCVCAGQLMGCASPDACNYNGATIDDGSCYYVGDPCDDSNAMTENDMYGADCTCAGSVIAVMGCTNAAACNFSAAANTDDGSCYFVGDPCDDGNAGTTNDVYNANCQCQGVVSVEEITAFYSVYPNPTNGFVTITQRDGASILSIEVMDATGKRVVTYNPNTSVYTLDMSGFAQGLYTLNMRTNTGVKSVRVQKN